MSWSGHPLRRGSRGAAVAELQQLLAAFGYDPGPVDGRFGLQTEEAVYQLQEDFRLRRDGIAGPEVARLLRSGLRAAASGARLAIPVRPVLVMADGEDAERLAGLHRLLGAHRTQVTALIVPWLVVGDDGAAAGKLAPALRELAQVLFLPLVAQVAVGTPEGLALGGRARRRAVAELARFVARYRPTGLHLVFPGLAPGEQHGAALLLAALRRALPSAVPLQLEVPLLDQTSFALSSLAAADRLVVRLPAQRHDEERSRLRSILRRRPAYEVYLGVPASGLRAELADRLGLVTRWALGGIVLWELAPGREAVFRALADLCGVQPSQAWAAPGRNIQRPGA